MNRTPSPDLRKYARVFSLYLLGGTVVLMLIRMFTDTSASGVSLMLPAISMWAAVGKFVEDHGRAPDDAERARLMKTGMVVTTVLLLVGTFFAGFAYELSGVFLAVILVLGLLFNWASLRLGFRMARGLPDAMAKRRR